jgi:hypothetical protein
MQTDTSQVSTARPLKLLPRIRTALRSLQHLGVLTIAAAKHKTSSSATPVERRSKSKFLIPMGSLALAKNAIGVSPG